MRAGDLRRRVSIQTRDTSRDSYGQQVLTWTDYMTAVPADIQPLTGHALTSAQAVYTEVTHTVHVRYNDALADPKAVATMRVVYQNGGVVRYFNIGAVINMGERNREIVLYTSEGANDG